MAARPFETFADKANVVAKNTTMDPRPFKRWVKKHKYGEGGTYSHISIPTTPNRATAGGLASHQNIKILTTYINVIKGLEPVDLVVKRRLVSFLHRECPDVRQSIEQLVKP